MYILWTSYERKVPYFLGIFSSEDNAVDYARRYYPFYLKVSEDNKRIMTKEGKNLFWISEEKVDK
jgi:hypothetical protein